MHSQRQCDQKGEDQGMSLGCLVAGQHVWKTLVVHDSSSVFFYDNDPLPFCSTSSWVKHFVGTCMEQKNSHKLEIIMADGKPWFISGIEPDVEQGCHGQELADTVLGSRFD